MKVAIFTSGYLRTFLYIFKNNIDLISKSLGECQVDVYYSFWDKNYRSNTINDPWCFKIDDTSLDEVDKEKIDKHLFSWGVNKVDGEIESFEISKELISTSVFPSEKSNLSSQYYKIHRVAEKYFTDEYDLYLTIRPDVKINNFFTEDYIRMLNLENSISVNEYYWYNETYNKLNCNECIWALTKNNFVMCNSQYLNLSEIQKQVLNFYSIVHGEAITAQHFNNLLSEQKISSIKPFNFDYRIFR